MFDISTKPATFIEGYRAAYEGRDRAANPHYAPANASEWDAGFVRAAGRINVGLPSEVAA